MIFNFSIYLSKQPHFQVEEMFQTTKMANGSDSWFFYGSYEIQE